MPALICILVWLQMVAPAAAHGSEPHGSGNPWTFDPWVMLPLGLIAALYGIGASRLAFRTARPRGMVMRVSLFLTGMLALAGALVSPLHSAGEHLFTFHMIEHEIVMAVAAPLLVLARPVSALLWGLPGTLRHAASAAIRASPVRGAWNLCATGGNATILHGVAIWAWHVPALFDTTVTSLPMHRLQHLSFVATAILFWWAVVWRSDHGSAAWRLFVTMIHTGLLGALLSLMPRVLYTAQTQAAPQWGLTPLEDQQLAGMIMWIPAGTIYAGAALAMVALWIRGSGLRRVVDG